MNSNFELDPASWVSLRELLQRGMDLPASEREGWLQSLDARFATLQPRLRELLAHADDALLDTLPKLEAAGALNAPGANQPNDQVGPYRLLRLLGEGGMGNVWLAERTDVLTERQVALKLPHGALRRADLAERMAGERGLLARLAHPNIARLYDAGVSATGQPYLALEYVQGLRIDTYCVQHRLTVQQRLRLLVQVARAVAHAHANLIVHRDLKPSNILVTTAGEVRLLDFGIAKLLVGGVAEVSDLTREAGPMLSLHYAAPEQLLGDALSTATDVYALGVVMYELLCGMRPYRLKRETRGALEDAIAEADIQPPSQRSQDPALRRVLRGDLDTIVLKALKKAPEARYRSIDEFADDIERYLARRPVLAQADSSWYRLRKFLQRNALPVGASAAALGALLAGAAVALWQANQALAAQQRAEQVKDFIGSIFADADPFSSGPDAVTVRGLLQRADVRVRESFSDRPDTRMELANLLASGMIGIGDFPFAEATLQQAIADGTEQLGATHPLTLQARVQLTSVHRFMGRLDEMQRELAELLPLLQGMPNVAARDLVLGFENSAHLAIDQGRHDDAVAAARTTRRLAVERLGLQHPASVSAQALLAVAYQYTADKARALQEADQALREATALYDESHPIVWNARGGYARALGNLGRFSEAVTQLKEVVRSAAAVLGADAPMVGFYSADIARFQHDADQMADSLLFAQRAIAVVSQLADANSYTSAVPHMHAGRALLGLRRLPEATAMLRKAQDALRVAQGPEAPLVADIDAHLALLAALQGDSGAAEQRMAALLTHVEAEQALFRFRALHYAGIVARIAGNYPLARDRQNQALQALTAGDTFDYRRAFVEGELLHLALQGGAYDEAMRLWPQLHIDAGTVPASARQAELLVSFARTRLALHDAAGALPALQAAQAFWRGQPEALGRYAGEVSYWLARTYRTLNQHDRARRAFAEAKASLAESPFAQDRDLVLQTLH